MDEKSLDELFEDLVAEARQDLRGICIVHSQLLAQRMRLISPETTKIIHIKRKDGELLVPRSPITSNLKWNSHYCAVYNNQVWDPSFGAKFIQEDYFAEAFPNQELEIKEVPADTQAISAWYAE